MEAEHPGRGFAEKALVKEFFKDVGLIILALAVGIAGKAWRDFMRK
jgi:hypothetical protein